MPVAIPGMSGQYKKEIKWENKKVVGGDRQYRLAWSKVPVTITSLASVCGLF
jgi:hypothetical protein